MSVHPNVTAVEAVLTEYSPGSEVHHLSDAATTAALAAAALGCEVGAIANSLVFVAGDEPLLIMTSGAHRVDLEFLARTEGVGPIRRATPDEVRAVTGQAIGGVAPVAHPAPLRTLVDADLAAHPTVWAAAGTPHTVFPITFPRLVAMTAGTVVAVVPRS